MTEDFYADWALEHPGKWFPFAKMGGLTLFVNPKDTVESYWAEKEESKSKVYVNHKEWVSEFDE